MALFLVPRRFPLAPARHLVEAEWYWIPVQERILRVTIGYGIEIVGYIAEGFVSFLCAP